MLRTVWTNTRVESISGIGASMTRTGPPASGCTTCFNGVRHHRSEDASPEREARYKSEPGNDTVPRPSIDRRRLDEERDCRANDTNVEAQRNRVGISRVPSKLLCVWHVDESSRRR